MVMIIASRFAYKQGSLQPVVIFNPANIVRVFTVFSLMYSLSAISLLDKPSPMHFSISISLRELVEQVSGCLLLI